MEKILVVNNDIDTMTLIRDLLEKQSYHVKYTSGGEEGIRIAENFEPDVVLIDVLQKGYIHQFKTLPATALTPVILMTGYSWNNEKGNETAADAIIKKPFYFDQLHNKIKDAIAQKEKG